MGEPLTTPRELLGARLRSLLRVELTLAERALPQLLEQARSTDLRRALERQLLGTEGRAGAVRELLHDLRLPAEPEPSPALDGLLEEHRRLAASIVPDAHALLDLAHAGAASAAGQLESAACDALVALAEALGEEAAGIRLRGLHEQGAFALEQLERARTRLLAEKVESAGGQPPAPGHARP